MKNLAGLIPLSACLLLGCGAATPLKRADPPPQTPAEAPFEFVRQKMGGPFKILLYAKDQASADRAAEAGFARVDQLNSILSDYDPESEISRLSRRTLE